MSSGEQAGLISMETHEVLSAGRTEMSAGVYRLDLDGKGEAPVWWKHSLF